MIRIRLLGALRTVLEYVVFVMGGTAILVMSARGLGILWSFNPEPFHPGLGTALVSGFVYFYALVISVPLIAVWGMVVPQISSWIFVALILYAAAVLLAKIPFPALISRIALAVMALYCSGRVIMFFSPAILHDVAAILFTMLFAGILGGVYGFFLFPRVRNESPRTSPMLLRHWMIAGVWLLLFSASWAQTEYMRIKIHSVKDPQLQLYFVKWTPAAGDVREEPIGQFGPRPHTFTDDQIEELRAAGMTGILQTWGHSGNDFPPPPPGTCRFVIVMSRPVREPIDLPKPAAGDIVYIQTEQGWRVFPSQAQTVSRTVRLTFFGPGAHLNLPSTRYSVDIGLGHRAEIPSFLAAFSWLPGEFQAPLPSLPNQTPAPSHP